MRYPSFSRMTLAVVCLTSTLSLGVTGNHALAQQSAITPDVNIDQIKLENGDYTLRKVLESGGQFFTVPYIPYDKVTKTGDGYGEGPDGPRNAQRYAFYPVDYPKYHFLRLNGLDSQSCYECHNSIGQYVEPGTKSKAMIRKPTPVGGSGGSNSNAFINPEFPYRQTYIVRSPPHVFGSGYTQSMATQMSHTLMARRKSARIVAKNTPGHPVEFSLLANGQSYGSFTTTFYPRMAKSKKAIVFGCDKFSTDPTTTFGVDGFIDDYSESNGVACDLVIRPFQWKGISSSVRHFARDALDFHLSMQAVEKYGDLDCDKDGKINEMSLGNVSALVSFVTMFRPPHQVIPKSQSALIAQGEKIFKGKVKIDGYKGNMCASCHATSMVLDTPILTIDNPGKAKNVNCQTLDAGLVSPVPASQLAVARKFNESMNTINVDKLVSPLLRGKVTPNHVYQSLREAMKKQFNDNPSPGYRINLNNPGKGINVPSYVYPRLKPNSDNSVDIPLFSDLRMHNMGEGLQDVGPQGADVDGLQIPKPMFLTRPLWGVADTGPWLHDGRALTLHDAILQHKSKGSEANPVINAFLKLDPAKQAAVEAFLLSLQLPVQQGLKIKN
jgi:cytochrome c peroxidase